MPPKGSKFINPDLLERLATERADEKLLAMTIEQTKQRILDMTTIALTEELMVEITALVLDGNYPAVVARKLMIPVGTFQNWINKGEEMIERELYGTPEDPEGLRPQLYLLVSQAEANFEVSTLEDLQFRIKEGKINWQGDMAILERRFPQRWSKRDAPPAGKGGFQSTVRSHIRKRVEAEMKRRGEEGGRVPDGKDRLPEPPEGA